MLQQLQDVHLAGTTRHFRAIPCATSMCQAFRYKLISQHEFVENWGGEGEVGEKIHPQETVKL